MVRLIWVTPNAENHISYCARVSNPKNQDNPEISKLLNYCLKNKHFSIFEMASMCIEVTTTRMISAQILRHKSLSFQEFSQRYSPVTNIQYVNPRRQDVTNRQNSLDDLSKEDVAWWNVAQQKVSTESLDIYNEALKRGIAKETARAILPMASETRMYISGTIRSFIHYLEVRTDVSTQLEHREVANEIKKVFVKELPIISEALEWTS